MISEFKFSVKIRGMEGGEKCFFAHGDMERFEKLTFREMPLITEKLRILTSHRCLQQPYNAWN